MIRVWRRDAPLFDKVRHCLAFVLCCLCWPLVVAAEPTAAPREAKHSASLATLAESRQWLDLLHVHATWFSLFPGSQIDSPSFFLSGTGKTDPVAELQATFAAFQQAIERGGVAQDDDPRCRFPARYRWLRAQLPEQLPAPPACAELDQWMQTINGRYLTLVFPAAYLNSPSSMFGHTLVRVRSGVEQSALLDWAVNYAANIDPADNQLVFSVKGLAGGYPGVLSLVPYHQKINEYSRIEARDLFEYDLDLTPEEVARFLYHVWELREAESAYYFFTENCSYHLLTLIDAASDRYALSGAFRWRAIPADTVRELERAGAITTVRYRPSALTELAWKRALLPATEQQLAADMAVAEPASLAVYQAELAALPKPRQAGVLELAYAVNRYRVARLKDDRSHLPDRGLWLLSQRARIGESAAFAAVPTPEVRDDQGHDTWRTELTTGRFAEVDYLDLGLRAAYHDLLDPLPGYPEGAQLEMFHLRLRQTLDAPRSLRLQTLRFVDIQTQSPRDRFLQPLSWGASFGLDRLATRDPLAGYLHGGAGYTVPWSHWRITAQLRGDSRVAQGLEKGFSLGTGGRLQLWRQHEDFSVSLHWERLWDVAGAELDRQEASLAVAVNPLRNQQWRFQLRWRELREQEGLEPQLSWHYYFY